MTFVTSAAPAVASVDGGLLAGTPWRLLAGLVTVLAGTGALAVIGVVPRPVLDVVTIVAGHGALLGTALGWAGVSSRPTLVTLALLAGAAAAAAAHPLGAIAWVVPVLRLARLAATGQLTALGLGRGCPPPAIALGVLAGVFLGAHALVSAALSVGYRPDVDPERYVSWVLFDVGAHVPATEAFFRGALFNRAQRRWARGPAMAVATAATVVRYLVDPLLPHAPEIVLGSVLYISLLSASSCWLFWRYGALAPGLAASLVFFAVYRALGAR